MNFFEQQDAAKKRTSRLVILFICAVVGILLAVNFATWGALKIYDNYAAAQRQRASDQSQSHTSEGQEQLDEAIRKYNVERGPEDQIPVPNQGRASKSTPPSAIYDSFNRPGHPGVYGVVSLSVLALMGMGTGYKMLQLARGGAAVAELLGGTRVMSTVVNDPASTQLLNVVEEMSIASGVPMPRVYVLEREAGINAFAAGLGTKDAVIGVTRGGIDKLTRDELQGVIAHEFSHILNGDMRLNLRMISLLNGIVLIAMAGYIIVRSIAWGGSGSSRRSSSDKDGGGAAFIIAILAIGVALIIIGSIGTFFARLIQAAISRQREYLADASAVQFTRNPGGIAGALKKLGARSSRSRIESPQSMAMAHLFFGNASGFTFDRLLATHPPLVDRIKAIDPTFDGKFSPAETLSPVMARYGQGRRVPTAYGVEGNGGYKVPGMPAMPGLPGGAAAMGMMMGMGAMAGGGVKKAPADLAPIPLEPSRLMDHSGEPTTEQLELAVTMMSALPETLVAAAHDMFSARSLVFSMLLDQQNGVVRSVQLETIRQMADDTCAKEADALSQQVAEAGMAARLPLLNLSLGSIRQMSPGQFATLLKITRQLIEADRQVDLFEYMIYKVLQTVGPENAPTVTVKFTAVSGVADEIMVLLGSVAGRSEDPGAGAMGFARGMRRMGIERPLPPAGKLNLAATDSALGKLAQASPVIRRRLMEAVAECVVADGRVSVEEAELVRAISVVLDCPLPGNLASLGG